MPSARSEGPNVIFLRGTYRCSYTNPISSSSQSSSSSARAARPALMFLSKCHLNLRDTSLSVDPAESKTMIRSGLIRARICNIDTRIHDRRVRINGTRFGVNESSFRRSRGWIEGQYSPSGHPDSWPSLTSRSCSLQSSVFLYRPSSARQFPLESKIEPAFISILFI